MGIDANAVLAPNAKAPMMSNAPTQPLNRLIVLATMYLL